MRICLGTLCFHYLSQVCDKKGHQCRDCRRVFHRNDEFTVPMIRVTTRPLIRRCGGALCRHLFRSGCGRERRVLNLCRSSSGEGEPQRHVRPANRDRKTGTRRLKLRRSPEIQMMRFAWDQRGLSASFGVLIFFSARGPLVFRCSGYFADQGT